MKDYANLIERLCRVYSGTLPHDAYEGAAAIKSLIAERDALQAKLSALNALVPLTDERIDELEDAAFRDYMEGRIDCYTYAVARAIESAHGIGENTCSQNSTT